VGKTYVTLRLIAAAQAEGMACCYIDCEGAFDPEFAELVGVDLEALTIHRQVNGHRVFDIMEAWITSGAYDLIVMDSIASLLPKSEAENEIESATMGTAQARLMSLGLRKVTTALSHSEVALVYVNQIREAIGVMFGDRTVTSGGKAMGHYAGVRLEIVRSENIKRKARVVNPQTGSAAAKDVIKAHRALLRVKKDKTGGAFQHATSTFVFDYELKGIDHLEDLIYLGRQFGLVHKQGSHWWMDGCGDEKQVGRGKFKSWLRKNQIVADELEELIREAAANSELEEGEDEDVDDEG
jgi:recombination protein RecA